MKSYRRRFAILLLVSLLLHLALFLWWRYSMEASQQAPSEDKTVEVMLRPLPELESPEAEHEPPPIKDEPPKPEPVKEEPEPVEKKPEPVEEAPEQPETPEAAPAPVDNADQFASDNQEDRSKTKVDFGASPKTKKAEETKLSDQIQAPEPKEEPSTLSQKVEAVEKIAPPKVAPEVVEEEIKEEQKAINKTLITESDQSKILVDQAVQEEKTSTKADQPVESEQASKPEPDLLDLITGKADIKGKSSDFELEIPQEYLDSLGNMEMLNELALKEMDVQHPFSEQKSKELQLANEYLERMNKQVMSFWVNPYKGSQILHGIIKLELDAKGYIVNVYVYRSSGDALLDISVEDAIRSVRRFQVPANEIIANRYYRNLRFHYSSKETSTELMPFEKDQEQE